MRRLAVAGAVVALLAAVAAPAQASQLLGARTYYPAMLWTAADGSHMRVNLTISVEVFDAGGCRPYVHAKAYRDGAPWPVYWYYGTPRINRYDGHTLKTWGDQADYGADVRIAGSAAEGFYAPAVTTDLYATGGYFAARNRTASIVTGWHYHHPASQLIRVAPGC
jgi:hypothetical protein